MVSIPQKADTPKSMIQSEISDYTCHFGSEVRSCHCETVAAAI